MEETIEINLFTCSICLSEEVEGDKQCITGCNHSYCLDCINQWLNQGTITCPMCRETVRTYHTNNEQHHIISIYQENQNNRIVNELRMSFIQIRNKLYYTNFMLFLSFVYFIYSFYENNILTLERDSYKSLYKNCTGQLIENNLYMRMIEEQDKLSSISIFTNNRLYNCFFPLYYIQKCMLNQH